MSYKLKENLPTIEILLGCTVFLYFILCSTISFAILWVIFSIYIWLFTTIVLGQYNFKTFANLICSSGIAISISLFFIYGIEELPYPEGALMFHVQGIVKSLILFFVSTVPLILLHKKNIQPPTQTRSGQIESKKQNYNHEKWEEATIEDIESGDYETI